MSSRESADFNQALFAELVEEGPELVEEFEAVDPGAVVVTPLKTQGVISDRFDLKKVQIAPLLE